MNENPFTRLENEESLKELERLKILTAPIIKEEKPIKPRVIRPYIPRKKRILVEIIEQDGKQIIILPDNEKVDTTKLFASISFRKKEPEPIHICLKCKNNFTTTNHLAKLCPTCKAQVKLRVKTGKIPVEKMCLNCKQQTFVTISNSRKYCDVCRKLVFRNKLIGG
jgi:hypothetical protein